MGVERNAVMTQATPIRGSGTVTAAVRRAVRTTTGEARVVQIVSLAGEFDLSNAGDIERAIERGVEAGANDFIADLSEVDFLDGRAVHALVDGWKRAARRNGHFVVVDPPARVWRVLVLVGVSRTFRAFPTRQEALAYLAGASR